MVVIVSHDCFFLDNLVSRVIELRDGRCREYLGKLFLFHPEAERDGGRRGLDAHRCRSVGPRRKSFKTKEEKRLEAEERNRLSRIMSDFKKELKTLEDHIIHLEEKKVEKRTLCEPSTHRDGEKVRQLNQELHQKAKEPEDL